MDYNNSLLEQVSLTKSIHRMKNLNPLDLTCNGFKPEGSMFLESEIQLSKIWNRMSTSPYSLIQKLEMITGLRDEDREDTL